MSVWARPRHLNSEEFCTIKLIREELFNTFQLMKILLYSTFTAARPSTIRHWSIAVCPRRGAECQLLGFIATPRETLITALRKYHRWLLPRPCEASKLCARKTHCDTIGIFPIPGSNYTLGTNCLSMPHSKVHCKPVSTDCRWNWGEIRFCRAGHSLVTTLRLSTRPDRRDGTCR